MKLNIWVVAILIFLPWAVCSGLGDEPESNNKQGITRAQADAILEELRQIHRLLEMDQQAPDEPTTTTKLRMEAPADSFTLGKDDAPLTLVEFMDYQCPFCRRFHQEAFTELKKQYIDTGKLRFISVDLPLGFHANALSAAEAARCAGEQGKYWEMREELLLHSDELDQEGLRKHAQANGLKADRFRDCMESEKYKSAVQKQANEATSLSVAGTPTFLLAKTSKELIGEMIVGARPYSFFDSSIKQILDAKPSGASSDVLDLKGHASH